MLAAATGVATMLYLRGAQQSATAASGQQLPSGAATSATAPGARPGRRSLVKVTAAAAARPGARAAARLVTRYFTAINRRDYPAYLSLLTPGSRRQLTRQAFLSGWGTTTDSRATLRRLSPGPGPGRERTAQVTFTSHQKAANSPVQADCTRWRIVLYLVPAGTGYLIRPPPASYHAAYRRCG